MLDEEQDVLLNPVLLVEVLSPSTESYDRGQKFAFYRSIPTLKEYVLVSQRERRVEVFRKNEAGFWVLHEADEQGAIVLDSVGATLHLNAIYANVKLENPSLR